ncbi:MAG: ClpXP protease specificity-enhancing factor SspB [uncultured Paraburkholderia sp.]|nr:MAG: ClpXP protease specificity-enhancing factor SspB [uncultured Paraburkholderia sp.]CAH2796560.1 MAG: ClpXP protease specificity-enhancing factor SspB [uncultured Paraburkholderia sp.]CAH2931028.1 MAG: ClpXP protease specificity-enhancing factor SspB [uncultured Paraburkholderia sp.]CAH2932063.1 MAG: ClpXP protease specificity-enhancing factor SspB [uncultured Paraburkholderia sp.]
MQEISTKPYLLRALYEWCTDNGYTPHIAVRVDNHTRVPRQFVRDNEIVLNISFEATSQLQMGNEWVEFSARFSGKSHKIEVPVANILAIYARENGQGMAFPVESTGGEAQDSGADAEAVQAAEPVASPAAPRAVESPSAADAAAKTDRAPEGDQPDDDGSKGGGRARLKIVK